MKEREKPQVGKSGERVEGVTQMLTRSHRYEMHLTACMTKILTYTRDHMRSFMVKDVRCIQKHT
jgi:hypothetical protein